MHTSPFQTYAYPGTRADADPQTTGRKIRLGCDFLLGILPRSRSQPRSLKSQGGNIELVRSKQANSWNSWEFLLRISTTNTTSNSSGRNSCPVNTGYNARDKGFIIYCSRLPSRARIPRHLHGQHFSDRNLQLSVQHPSCLASIGISFTNNSKNPNSHTIILLCDHSTQYGYVFECGK